jgi:hypothetical protein
MVCCLVCESDDPSAAGGRLESLARSFSPRVMPCGDTAVLFDASGLSRVCGPPPVIARELQVQAADEGLQLRLALAGTLTAAWVLAHARAGCTIVTPGAEAEVLAPLPLGWLLPVVDLDRAMQAAGTSAARVVQPDSSSPSRFRRGRGQGRNYRLAPAPSAAGPSVAGTVTSAPADAAAHRRLVQEYRERLATFERWGIRTCGDLAGLPRADVHARMGPAGVRLHQAASGEDLAPLVPFDESPVFGARIDLEWPIEGLEPLSFVLARQCEQLATQLERADRGAVAIDTTLHLTTRTTHVRRLELPAPMRDARVLRTLILLDLESHPPPAGIDAVELRVDVAPGRIVQRSLLARAVPSPEQLSTLLARLGALAGTDRIGAPVLVDTHDGRATQLTPFRTPRETTAPPATDRCAAPSSESSPVTAFEAVPHLRRFRRPLAVQVSTSHGVPARVVVRAHAMRGGRVRVCAGPWRTSGGWWDPAQKSGWDRDEWDVELEDGSVCRLVRQRATGQWEIEGTYD